MARWKDVKKGKIKKEVKSKIHPKVHYAGFWSRFFAIVTDMFMIGIPIGILVMVFFGYDTMQAQPGFIDAIEGVKPEKEANPFIPVLTMSLWAVIVLGFWYKTGQTPGKKMAQIVIVDSKTFKKPSFWQLIVRLLFLVMPLFTFVSMITMLFPPKKRTLHDIFSGTCVIYKLK